MITVYYKKANTSCYKALECLDKYAVEYKKCHIENMTKEIIVLALSMTNNGISDILKHRGDSLTRKLISNLYEMTMNEAIDFLEKHPEIIKVPLILSENKLLVGYHKEEIRKFIPSVKLHEVSEINF